MSNHLTTRTIENIVSAANRAPSVHNSQPWYWTFADNQLDLYADWSRQVKHGDPDRRDLEISCGAALHHAVVQAAAEGFRATVHRMPDDNDATHLASLTFRRTDRRPSAEVLAKAIYARYTDRRTPSSTPVHKKHLKELVTIGAEWGAFVIPVREREDRTLVKDLRQLAVLLQHDDDQYLAELERWAHSRGDDGVPDGSVLAQNTERSRFNTASRFPAGALRDQRPTDADPAPSWIVVATSSDDTMSRLRAGEALSAILLRATLLGLAVVPYTQAVEVDATRNRLEERILHGGRCLQLILRVAVSPADRTRLPMTRRRSVHDVLKVTERIDAATG